MEPLRQIAIRHCSQKPCDNASATSANLRRRRVFYEGLNTCCCNNTNFSIPHSTCTLFMDSESCSRITGSYPEVARLQLENIRQLAKNHSLAYCVRGPDARYLEVNSLFASNIELPVEKIIGATDAEIDAELKTGNTQPRKASTGDTVAIHQSKPSESRLGTLPQVQLPLTDDNGNTIAVVTVTGTSAIELLESTVEARNNELAILEGLMTDLLANQSLDKVLGRIAEIMIGHTDANQSLILLVDETAESMKVVAAAGPDTQKNLGKIRKRGIGFAGVAWDTSETQHIANSDNNYLTRGYWPSNTELLAVPLTVAKKVIGIAVLGAPADSANLSRYGVVVNHLSNLASYAIAAASSMEKANKELHNSRGISEISHMMTSITDIDELMDSVAKALVETFDFSKSTFFVIKDRELVSKNTWIKTSAGIQAVESMAPELAAETSCFWSYVHKESVFIPRKTEDSRESARIHELRTELRVGCSVAMPVVVGNNVFAVLMICKDRQQPDCDESELNLLSSIAQQLSAAIYGIQATTALRHQAYHDSLTGLPNRRSFEAELHIKLQSTQSEKKTSALLYLDLDGFKAVNDALGHGSGDNLLQLVAKRLVRGVRKHGTVSRLGGDEFGVILSSVDSPQEAFRIAQNIRQSVLNPFVIGESVANIGTSIGLCLFPEHGDSVDVLLRNADEAMYQAKAAGKNKVLCYEEYMAQEAKTKIRLESELHDALDRCQFVLHYQPQVDPLAGKVVGVEALIRWRHPERGLVLPGEFIPVAEDAGLINELGAWVLKEAISQLGNWKSTQLSGLKVSVNIAASQFLFGDISSRIDERLQQYDVKPEMLEIELTESVVMKDINLVAKQLNALQDLGVTVAIDDFGTGYSSLSYLQDLPLDVLKIDRAFVARLTEDKTEDSIVKTIVLLASGLGLQTVAEGVETGNQLDQIVELGCNLIQGYYYSKPCALEELETAVVRIENQFGHRQVA